MGYYDRNMKSRTNSVGPEPTWLGYINATLSKQYLDAFNVWLEDGDADIFTELSRDLSDGSRLSVKWDDKNMAFVATLTSTKAGQYQLDGVATLSAFAETPETAIALLVFKHVLYLERDWSREPRASAGSKRG